MGIFRLIHCSRFNTSIYSKGVEITFIIMTRCFLLKYIHLSKKGDQLKEKIHVNTGGPWTGQEL